MARTKSEATENIVPSMIQRIAVSDIRESPFNQRKIYNGLDELGASIAQHGLFQPVVVRIAAGDGSRVGGFELVFGHRRLRAAKLAHVGELDARVVKMGDREVLEAQVVENVQREDVHPLEEAESFEALMSKHNVPAEEIAAKVGKSRSYVFGRLKLLALSKKTREAFYKGRISASHALLLARIPHGKLQEEALEEMIRNGRYEDADACSYRRAVEIVHGHYMLRLAEAPFDTADANLVKKAGACTVCPKRTGNQPELFSDVKSADVCTDTVCFGAKRDAAWAAKAVELEEAGHSVLTEKEAKKVLTNYGSLDLRKTNLVDLESGDYRYPEARGKSFGQLLGKKHELRLTYIRKPDGKVAVCADQREVQKAIREKYEWAKPKPSKSNGASHGKSKRNGASKETLEAEGRRLALPTLLDRAARDGDWPVEAWRIICTVLARTCADPSTVYRRRWPEVKAAHEQDKAFHRFVTSGDAGPLRALALELLLDADYADLDSKTFDAIAKAFSLDVKPFIGEARRKATEEAKATDKPKAKRSGRKGADAHA